MATLGVFDIVTCFETLYYFKKNEIKTVISNISNITKNGGYLMVTYHLPDKMNYGKYIKSLGDINKWFKEFEIVWGMDFYDNHSHIYNKYKFGRHLFSILKRK